MPMAASTHSIPSTMPPPDSRLSDQPVARVRRGDVEFVLLGTAHVSRASAEAVRSILEREQFDAVAVELCESRFRSLRNPEAFRDLDLFQVIRQGKAGLVASLLTREDVSEDEIEKLKQGDLLGSMFSEFARESPPLYEALIAERDRFMTASLRDE